MNSGKEASAPGKPRRSKAIADSPNVAKYDNTTVPMSSTGANTARSKIIRITKMTSSTERDDNLVVADAGLLGVVVHRRCSTHQSIRAGHIVEDAAHLDHGLLGRVGVGSVSQCDIELHESVHDQRRERRLHVLLRWRWGCSGVRHDGGNAIEPGESGCHLLDGVGRADDRRRATFTRREVLGQLLLAGDRVDLVDEQVGGGDAGRAERRAEERQDQQAGRSTNPDHPWTMADLPADLRPAARELVIAGVQVRHPRPEGPANRLDIEDARTAPGSAELAIEPADDDRHQREPSEHCPHRSERQERGTEDEFQNDAGDHNDQERCKRERRRWHQQQGRQQRQHDDQGGRNPNGRDRACRLVRVQLGEEQHQQTEGRRPTRGKNRLDGAPPSGLRASTGRS